MTQRKIPTYIISSYKEKKTDYCIGIPVLNEGARIIKQLEEMNKSKIHEIADIIIFDGNSTDGALTDQFLKSVNVRTLLTKTGPGAQGAQFRMGFDYILNQEYKGIITIDGNNKDSIEEIPQFISLLENGYDFIQGSRFAEGGQAINTPLSRLYALKFIHAPWISALSGFKYTDTTSAYRGIASRVLKDKKLNIFRNIFSSYELLFYMSAKIPKYGYKTIEIGVTRQYPKNTKTPTKISMWGNVNIILTLLKLTLGFYDNNE